MLDDAVTSVIEQEMNGADGLQYVESQSEANGSVTITVTFLPGTNPDLAAVDVQNRIKRVESRLPQAVTQQGVQVNKARSNILMFVGASSTDGSMDPAAIGDYLARNVVNEIKRLPGVGQAQLFGTERAMRVWVDPAKLVGYKLTMADVTAAIRAQNAQVTAGTLGDLPAPRFQTYSAPVVVQGQLTSPEEFGKVVLRASGTGATVRLADVARIEMAGANFNISARLNGKPFVAIAVQQSLTGNALATAELVRNKMEELSKFFPPGLSYTVPDDTSLFVKISIEEVVKTLLEAVLLVFIVMYVFLQNFRYTLIPTIVVPVALLGTFAVMQVAGFSINVLTMFGMVLAIGILVDDAIVVVENVERIMSEEGLSPREATRKAMSQITGAIIGITLVLIAVFIPMAFFGGAVGAIYRQFAVHGVVHGVLGADGADAHAGAVRHHPETSRSGPPPREERLLRLVQPRLRQDRHRLPGRDSQDPHPHRPLHDHLPADLRRGGLAVRAPAVVLPAERGPGLHHHQRAAAAGRLQEPHRGRAEQGRGIHGQAARRGAHHRRGRLQLLGQRPERRPGVRAAEGLERTRRGRLGREDRRARVRRAVGHRRRHHLPAQPSAHPRTGQRHRHHGAPAGPQLAGPRRAGGRAQPAARPGRQERSPGGRAPEGLEDAPQLQIDIDRDKANALGVAFADINSSLSVAFGSSYVNDFTSSGRQQRVVVQADAPQRLQPEDLLRLNVRSASGSMVPMSSFATSRWINGPVQLVRYNGYPAIKLTGNAAPGRSTGEAMAELERLAQQLPPGFGIEWTGQSLEEKTSGSQAPALFALSMLAAFLVLAALYESESIPVAVLLVVPLGVLGALLGATIRSLPNDVYFKVGLIAIIGLSAKNAILIIEFAKDLQAQGKGLIEATLEAVHLRFRPIIMTSLAFILGVLPLVVASGAGSASQRAIGTGVMGGMITATVLAVFLVPVFFVVVRKIFKGSERQRRLAAHELDLPEKKV